MAKKSLPVVVTLSLSAFSLSAGLAQSKAAPAAGEGLGMEGAGEVEVAVVAKGPDRIIVGGGFDPASSAVALEQNLLDYKVLDPAAVFLYGGGSDVRQLDVAETDASVNEDDLLFSLVLQGKDVDPRLHLRHNRIPTLSGAATVTGVKQALAAQASRVASSRARARFFYTGHGSAGGTRKEPFARNVLALWDGTFDVPAYARALESLPPGARSLTVMTQCYSGGFANLIWSGGEKQLGVLRPTRCGFFSQRADRPAAGCSPDLANRDEYSVSFFEALRGKSLDGKIVIADFDGDGRLSAREAHGHAVATLASIDVPLSTSDHFLAVEIPLSRIPKAARTWALAQWKMRFSPWEDAVVESLVRRLSAPPPRTAPLLTWLEREIEAGRAQAEAVDNTAEEKRKALDDLAWSMSQTLARTEHLFTSLVSVRNGASLAPSVEGLARARMAFLSHPRRGDLTKLLREAAEADTRGLSLAHGLAVQERLLHLIETKAREVALPARGPSRSAFEALRTCESQEW